MIPPSLELNATNLIARVIEEINRCFCGDCGIFTIDENYYMVHDSIWERYGNGKGMLCIKCLEKRMHRKLTRSDFTTCPFNLPYLLSP